MQKSIYYGVFSIVAFVSCLWLVLIQDTDAPKTQPQETQLTTWNPIHPFLNARRAFAAANSQHHIYLLGGVDKDGRYLNSVEFAPIHDDGSLGTWQETTPLNNARFYLSASIIDNYIYAIGGADGPLGEDNLPSATVEKAEILPNGQLGPWQLQAYLTTPRRGLQSVVYGPHIYALGGYNGQFLKTVERAKIDAHGNIENWIEEPLPFIIDRYIHSAAIYDNRIYLIAGHVEKQNKMSYADVESARIEEDGSLSEWRIEKSKLNTPRFIASAIGMNQNLYIAGGHDGADRLTHVEYASIQNDGSLSDWKYTLPLHTARSATVLLSHANNLYILGGAGGQHVLNSVETSQQLPSGKLIATAPRHSPTEQ